MALCLQVGSMSDSGPWPCPRLCLRRRGCHLFRYLQACCNRSCFWKVYSVLLDTRMSHVAEKEDWCAEGKGGFRSESGGTVDHVFVLRHLIEATQSNCRLKPMF